MNGKPVKEKGHPPTWERAHRLPVERCCEGCSAPLPKQEGRGRPRKWCSETCRKNTCYGGVCEDCGGPTAYAGSHGTPRRCSRCNKTKNLERNERIIAAWNRWEPGWMIAEREGISEDNVLTIIDQHRRAGRDIILHRKRNREVWDELERLYLDGVSFKEIGKRLDASPPNVAEMLHSMREAGYHLPYRRPRHDARFPELVAS